MQATYITKVTTENTGGGCMVDFIHLADGRVITLNDECACLYESVNHFYQDTDTANGDLCKASMAIPQNDNKKYLSYDFQEGQLIELFHGRPQDAWTIYDAPDEKIRAAIAWNDKDGDFDECDRKTMLEIFLHNFIISKP